jgi:hypothetical protein
MSRIVLADVPFVKRHELRWELSSIDHVYWDSKIFLCMTEPMPAGHADFPAASGALYLFRRKMPAVGLSGLGVNQPLVGRVYRRHG